MMDKECVALCDAINSIPGLSTFGSCCGHDLMSLWVGFHVDSLEYLPVLLYHIDKHPGVRCEIRTDDGMSQTVLYLITNQEGPPAYADADTVAAAVKEFVEGGGLEWYDSEVK